MADGAEKALVRSGVPIDSSGDSSAERGGFEGGILEFCKSGDGNDR